MFGNFGNLVEWVLGYVHEVSRYEEGGHLLGARPAFGPGGAVSIWFLDLTPNLGKWTMWSYTPTVAALLMLLVVTREGYFREGWKVLEKILILPI